MRNTAEQRPCNQKPSSTCVAAMRSTAQSCPCNEKHSTDIGPCKKKHSTVAFLQEKTQRTHTSLQQETQHKLRVLSSRNTTQLARPRDKKQRTAWVLATRNTCCESERWSDRRTIKHTSKPVAEARAPLRSPVAALSAAPRTCRLGFSV
eukprot:2165259-Rhodomonas_salina.5